MFSYDTLITGRRPRPNPESSSLGQALSLTHGSQSSNVISNLPTAIGWAIVTACIGPSLSTPPTALSGDPIMNLPAGTTTIGGQVAQSLNSVPGAGPAAAEGAASPASMTTALARSGGRSPAIAAGCHTLQQSVS